MDTAGRLAQRAAGACLLVAGAANLAAVVMFNVRQGPSGGEAPAPALLQTERGLLMAAMVLSALGFCLLDGERYGPGAAILLRLGAFAYLTGGIVGVVAETLGLAGMAVYPTIVAYVTLAFTGQAIIGGALVASALVPRWIGWGTVLWNLAWLASLVIARPGDVYFPILHLVMPVVIGAALLRRPAPGLRRTATVPAQAPAGRP